MKAHIGPDLIRKLTARPPATLDIRDTKLTGFVVRCRASGVHSYVLRSGGRMITLGRVGHIAPEAARLTAESMRAAVSRNALSVMADDPQMTLTEARTQARGQVKRSRAGRTTFAVYVTTTYGPWVTQHRKTGDETITRLTRAFPDFADLRLAEISAFAVERWRQARHKAGAAPATTNRDLAALRGLLSRAVTWGHLKVNPLIAVKAARVDTIGTVRFLSSDEDARLRAALTHRDDRRRAERDHANLWRRERGYPELPTLGVYSDHLTPITLLALNSGLRRGELFDLRWADVDLPAGRLTVRSASAKSGHSRVLPLNTEAVEVLTTWRPAAIVDPTALIFASGDGARFTTLKTAFLKLLKDATIVGFRFHDCRHDFASKLVQSGVDLFTVSKLLGHSDTKMTTRYAHLSDSHLAQAVAKLVRA